MVALNPRHPAAIFLAALATAPASGGQIIPPAPADVVAGAPAPAYAEVADLVVASPLIIDATIRSATRIKGAEAAGAAPGMTRFYVTADVATLVRATGAIPARVGWLVDVAADARGRTPNLKRLRVLAFARAVPGSADQVQLIAPDAQRTWTPALDQTARRIAQEAAAPDAPPVITGIASAFHVPGSLPGEGETQIFLTTATGRPAALSVLRRPGEEPRWSVALSEVIDEAATAPARDTLLWYRLACALPPVLPERATTSLEEGDAAKAREDYALVLERLGACRPGSGPAQVSGDGARG